MSFEFLEPERWRAVEKLFHAALEVPANGRQLFLEDACDGDEALHAEAVSLLSALEGPEVFDEQAARDLTRQMIVGSPADAAESTFPERLGPYRLIEVLGEGGMGTVYLAEQSEPLPRQVALKLMHWGDADGRALRRFELEREALARMSHPTIAQVYGAGASEHGQPYVALEYIPGQPITEYCDSRRLDVRQRLELLMAVCDGVRHAHEKAVIHRDLKPSNLLVREVQGAPLPKIIDFGIAKCLESWSDSAVPMTRSRFRVGSPGYMSPEALAIGSQAVDTRSDVYSLGVVLCQLLIGVRPFETGSKRHRAAEAVADPTGDPPRPSRRFRGLLPEERRRIAGRRRMGENKLVRRLQGELDWIVLRAIAPEPADRYASVAELAADIERWLTGRPVAARPPSFTYRALKALRRHRVVATAVGLILATVVVFSIRANLLFHRAEASRQQAEELVSFMLDDLSAQLTPMGRLDLLESVARHSLAYFESGTGQRGLAGDRPAAALRQIGRVLTDRGDLQAALEAYERARRIDDQLWREDPGSPAARLGLAKDLALMAEIHSDRGEQRLTESYFNAAEEHLRSLVAEFPEHVPARRALATTLGTVIASWHRLEGNIPEAMALFEEALALVGDLPTSGPEDVELTHVLGRIRYGLGLLELYSLARPAVAARHFEAGAEMFQDLLDRHPASIWRYRLAVLKGHGLTNAYRDLDRLSEARVANREALGLLEVLVREEPSNKRWLHSLGWELIRQGQLASKADDLDLAATAFERSSEVHTDLLALATSPNIAWLDGLAAGYNGLTEVETRRGAHAAARDAAKGAQAALRRIVGEAAHDPYYRAMLVVTTAKLGELHRQLGDVASAHAAVVEAVALLEPIDAARVDDASVVKVLHDARRRVADLRLGLESARAPA